MDTPSMYDFGGQQTSSLFVDVMQKLNEFGYMGAQTQKKIWPRRAKKVSTQNVAILIWFYSPEEIQTRTALGAKMGDCAHPWQWCVWQLRPHAASRHERGSVRG